MEYPVFRYKLRRHGGASTHRWRTIHRGDDLALAERLFDAEALALRQGTVELVAGDEVIRAVSAPRLRRRW